jgi:hypothetical protein
MKGPVISFSAIESNSPRFESVMTSNNFGSYQACYHICGKLLPTIITLNKIQNSKKFRSCGAGCGGSAGTKNKKINPPPTLGLSGVHLIHCYYWILIPLAEIPPLRSLPYSSPPLHCANTRRDLRTQIQIDNNTVLRMEPLARQRFRIPLPLALRLPIGVWGQRGSVGQKFPKPSGMQVVRQCYRM